MDVRYAVLGPLTASTGAAEIDLGPAKQRAVLALLLLNANRPVSASAIVDAVWADDPPENGANVVQKHIAGLRRALEPDRSPRSPGTVLTLDGAGYRLHVAPGALDTETFETSVRTARALVGEGNPADAATGLRAALPLWRGEALAGLSGRVFETARRRLDDTRGAAWELLAEAELALGRHASLGAELARVVEEFPAREELRCALMLTLYRQGRPAEALTAFRAARDHLHDEFGVEPGERMQELHRRILRADPSLGPVAAAPATSPPTPPPVSHAPPLTPMIAPPDAAPVPQHPPGRFARRADLSGTAIVKALVVAGLAVLSLGLLTWLVIGVMAWVRRSRPHAAAAVVYLALTVGLFALFETGAVNTDVPSGWDNLLVVCLFGPMLLGAVHAGLLALFPRTPAESSGIGLATLEQLREAKREQARQILAYRPDIAAELGIGRPDLFRWYDDGGLFDVNALPETLLVSLPGMTATAVRDLVTERARGGPFGSLHELVARGALSSDRAYALRQLLVFGVTTPPRG